MNRIRPIIVLLLWFSFQAAQPVASPAQTSNQTTTITAPKIDLSAEKDPAPGTLAYHMATNAAGRARSFAGAPDPLKELSGWSYDEFTAAHIAHLTNAVWSTNFWLTGVHGLSATCISYSNGMGGQGLITMVSPRHYLFAAHMHPETYLAAFLDTNNVIHWRTTLQRADIAGDTAVGLLNADLPPSVGFLPVPPPDYRKYLRWGPSGVIQGIGMNQDMKLFSQPMIFFIPGGLVWSSDGVIPSGPGTNWSLRIRGGDSSDPEMLLIGNQLVLLSHNFSASSGPDYATQIDAINQTMHRLSTANHLRTDYQLTTYPLTNWPVVNL